MAIEDLIDGDDGGGGEEGAPAWMATFSDMATLLLTFFILLLSFANMDVENFKVALGSVKEAFGVQTESAGDFEAMSTSPIELSTKISSMKLEPDERLDELKQVIEYIKKHKLSETIRAARDPRGIVLRINDVVLFDVGSDKLEARAQEVLKVVADLAKLASGDLSIEGHTDDVPISRVRFPSNWELSTARATSVLRNFRDDYQIDVARMNVAGYADARPVATNDTPEGRAKNRRVEFVFVRQHHPDGKVKRIFRIPFAGTASR